MPALRKPHRVAFLVPELTVEGSDAPNTAEAALLLWIACIEVCQRHPGLAVHDPESTPLIAQDGHFTPQHARPGAAPDDSTYAPTRRDELVWLELALPRTGPVRLHALARDGQHEQFDATGRTVGDQIHQAIERWLAARGLGPLPRRFEAAEAADIVAAVRVFGPALGELARAQVQREAPGGASIAEAAAADRTELRLSLDVELAVEAAGGSPSAEPGSAAGAAAPARPADEAPGARRDRPSARALAARLTPTLRAPALRLLALALREDLGDLVLAADPDQPQALFDRFRAALPGGRDHALLRRILAIAPGWALPYSELAGTAGDPLAASALEIAAGAGLAVVCRPGELDVIQAAAARLAADGHVDDGIRLLERAVALHRDSSDAHAALLGLHRRGGRLGAWLAQARDSGALHGCPLDPALPQYGDQIRIDLLVADALIHAGRLDEAIALRAARLAGREASWPRHTRILERWRRDPRLTARSYARDGALRGEPSRALEGYGRAEPDDPVDVAFLLDALVAIGRDEEVALAWSQFGLGRGLGDPVARLAAARCLLAAGDWRRGIEELWRVELTEPARDPAGVARAGLLLACAPLDSLEAALGERVAIGAPTLARRMARDVADFAPGAARSSIVLRALGKSNPIDFDPAWLAGFAADTRSRRAIDAAFAEHTGDHLVNHWLEVAFTDAAEDDAAGLAQAAAYTAGCALGRYLAATTAAPSPLAGALRIVAAEALALVRRHRTALADRDARALLGALDPLLRRVDRWLGSAWLAAIERSCAIDERANGDVDGFARQHATVAARILGPEETAVLAASVARLHRDRPDGWASAVAAQASRLASHTGRAGVDGWADAVAVQLAAHEIELEDAIDALHTACYLGEGKTCVPAGHAARVFFAAGRAPVALGILCAGLGAGDAAARAAQLAALAGPWREAQVDVPLDPARVPSLLFEALHAGELARAEKLGRLAVALDPDAAESHRNLGLALARQGKIPEALHYLTRSAPEQATQVLCGVLYQSGQLADATAALDYASRWYSRADQWLTYGGIAYAAMDNPRAVAGYARAYRIDPGAFDPSQLNAYAAVLGELGDHAGCEAIAGQLLRTAGGDLTWKTTAWAQLATAYLGQGRFDQAIELAERAVELNPLPDNAAGFAVILERTRARAATSPQAVPPPGKPRAPVFALVEAGELAAAAALIGDPSWRVRRAALAATRFRGTTAGELATALEVRAAAAAVLADTAGVADHDAMVARELALAIRAQAHFARDPAAPLGNRMTRDAFDRELRARGGAPGEPAPPPPRDRARDDGDRVAVPDGRLARVSDYVALIRDLAVLTPREALAEFDLDPAGYLEVATAWAAAIAADPSLAAAIAAGLARR